MSRRYHFLLAMLRKLEDAVNPDMVQIVVRDGSVHYLPYPSIMRDIENNFEGCDPAEGRIIQDAVAPKWLVLSRDMSWAITHPVDT
jgi:hypothetical protein